MKRTDKRDYLKNEEDPKNDDDPKKEDDYDKMFIRHLHSLKILPHPTSKKVSIQLTKMSGSSSFCTQMLINLYLFWLELISQKF